MKLFFAFTALAAASTTPQPTTGQSTAAGQSTPSVSYSCAEHVDNIAEAVFWAQMGLAMTDAEVQQKTDDCEAACELEGADVTQCADAFESSGSFSSSSSSSSSSGSSSGSSSSTVTVSVECLDAQAALNATACQTACAGYPDVSCFVEEPANEACVEAEKALADSTSDLEKIALRETCKLACTGVEDAECGFLVNGLSFVLLAILAIFKY